MLPRKGPASCCFGDGCAGTWPLAPGTWHLFQVSVVAGGAEGFSVSLSCVVTCRSWHPATGTRLLAPGTWHPAPGRWRMFMVDNLLHSWMVGKGVVSVTAMGCIRWCLPARTSPRLPEAAIITPDPVPPDRAARRRGSGDRFPAGSVVGYRLPAEAEGLLAGGLVFTRSDLPAGGHRLPAKIGRVACRFGTWSLPRAH